jgi:hypothetical protein
VLLDELAGAFFNFGFLILKGHRDTSESPLLRPTRPRFLSADRASARVDLAGLLATFDQAPVVVCALPHAVPIFCF